MKFLFRSELQSGFQTIAVILSLTLALLVPVACGGGGGGSSSTSTATGSSTSDTNANNTSTDTSISTDTGTSTSASTSTSTNLPSQCSGACNAAAPSPPTATNDGGTGNVTMYSTSASAGGACGYGSTNVMYYAAISVNAADNTQGQWQGGRVCGQCAEVTALTSQGLKSVTVRIMDKCPDDNCGIDLGGLAPAAVMADGSGRYTGQWRFVACDGHPEVSDGPATLNVKDGSNAWWSRVRVHNPATGVTGIDWQNTATQAHGSFTFDTTNVENAYEVPTNEVLQSSASRFTITVHYVDGRTATVQLTPAQLGASGARYTLN